MSLPVVRLIGFLLLAVVGLPSSAAATLVTQPPGLLAGDKYRLIFVTSGRRDALSTSIGDYNSFVSSAAAAVRARQEPRKANRMTACRVCTGDPGFGALHLQRAESRMP